MLSLFEIKKILHPDITSLPEDDFRILDSWAEYDESEPGAPEDRPLEYLCYELETMDPDTGERTHYYKAVRFARVIRLPANAKQSVAFMDMQEQVLAGVYETDCNLITVIANMIKPVSLGLLYLYGIQGIASELEDAKKQAHEGFLGFVGMMQGTFRVLEMRVCNAQEAEWLREKMYNMDYLTVVRGIPKANKAGEDAGNKGVGGSNLNPDSQGTLEEIISGMVDYEYVLEILSTPVYTDTLMGWQRQSQKEMTEWYGQLQGTKALSMNLSIPISYMANASQSEGWSRAYTDASTVSYSQGESFTLTEGQTVGQSLSESFGTTIGQTEGYSLTNSISEGVTQTSGVTFGETFGVSQSENVSFSNGVNESVSMNEGLSTGLSASQGTSLTEGTSLTSGITHSEGSSYGLSEGSSSSLSNTISSSETLGYNQSESVNVSNSASYGTSASSSSSLSASQSYSNSENTSLSNTESASLTNGASLTLSNGDGSSYTDSRGVSVIVNGSGSETYSDSDSLSLSLSSSATGSASVGTSQSYGYSESTGVTASSGTTVGNSTSIGASQGYSTSAGTSVSYGASESYGTTTGSSIGQNWGTSLSDSESVSLGNSASYGTNSSLSQNVGSSYSTGASSGTSQSVSYGASTGSSYSQSVSQSESVSTSQTLGQSLGQSVSSSLSQSSTTGTSTSASQSESSSTGTSYTTSNGTSTGTSTGSTGTTSLGTSSSMGLGPSIGYSKTYQWMDQGVKDLLELLEYQNERIKKALRGQGAFYTYVYIACPSLDALATAQAVAKATWQNEYAFAQPLQVLDLTEQEQKHLLYHFSAFSSDVTKEDVYGVEEYKYCTVLLPEEYVAYTHLPRVSEGGVYSTVQDIPKFSVPSMMKGEIYMGTILNPERFSFQRGYRTQFDYRVSEDQLMHGFFTGASRSGKTVAAMRFVAELAQVRRSRTGKRLRIVAMDPKRDWRTLARFVEPDRFNFYSLGNVNLHPVKINPWKIPLGVTPQMWIDGVIDIYCRAYGLLERGKQMIADVIYELYSEHGVFPPKNKNGGYDTKGWIPPSVEEISAKSAGVNFASVYHKMEEKGNTLAANGRSGNDTKDAYARLLERLSCFSRPYSIECQLYGTSEGKSIDELIGADEVTVFESKGLENTFKNFIFGVITSGFYKFALAHEGGYLAEDQYETVLVIEEANEILTGNDAAGTGAKGGGNVSLSGQSEFEQILDQSAGYGLFIIAITQKIADMPSSIIANSGLVFAGRLKRTDDINVVVRAVAREERIDDRDLVKWFPRSPTGWFVCQSSRAYDFKDAEPILVQISRLNINPPSDLELDEILMRKKVNKYMHQNEQKQMYA